LHVRNPIWLQYATTPGAWAFAILFALDSLARAILATLIPLEALRLLGNAQQVSVLYFVVSLAGLLGSITVPWLIRRLTRRWVYTNGVLLMVLASLLIGLGTVEGQVAGMIARVFGVTCVVVCLNLYVLDHIKRGALIRFEPLRLIMAAGAWTVGPSLGVYLAREVSHWLPYGLTIVFAAALLGYFWFLRAGESTVLQARRGPLPSPLGNVARFFRQPRLRLAWIIAFGRSAWWSMFFIFAPIYAVQSGLGELAGGLIVSAGNAVLFTSLLWGKLAGRVGVRWVLIAAFVVTGLTTLLVAAFAAVPWIGVAWLLLGSLFVTALDVVGNVPFMRAVKPHQRAEMTAVFMTYRDFSDLVPPGIFALLLKAFSLPAVFVASGLSMLVVAYYARYVPKRF
jgi:MFS family permease